MAQEVEEAFTGRMKSREFASEKEKRGRDCQADQLGGPGMKTRAVKLPLNFHDSGAIESCSP